ncbi:hypothetical protein MUY14_09770 [Amycolatopsis sp. FBCC-B4732]|uniref:hypothetical protein n=1 Tax=Amycolatopsis sp. FBCC-B4732 TaxID=3079339 RepID=UPI001FF3A6A8|nr:hypothetical protein [Amycolatopsis sp. FBCC-B4732]UOX90887.1 hypothetical protein MUY14_09770 [Amycolatopsis sp. FBCC-B4732]
MSQAETTDASAVPLPATPIFDSIVAEVGLRWVDTAPATADVAPAEGDSDPGEQGRHSTGWFSVEE